jgi:peptidoglycan/LPS O-acetylase OafA/YrhL
LIALAALALTTHAWFLHDLYSARTIASKLAQVSLLPWLGFFLVGTVVRCHWPTLEWLLRGRLHSWLVIYVVAGFFLGQAGLSITGNAINTISALLLAGVVLAAAHTHPSLSDRLLGGNDISYGLYLYHGPFMNAALAMQLSLAPVVSAALVIVVSLFAATLSWRLVERPALALKAGLSQANQPSRRALQRTG